MFRIVFVSYLLVCCLTTIALGQGIEFRWKLEPGMKLVSEVTQEIQQSATGGAEGQTTKVELIQDWQVIENLGDGKAKIATTLRRAKLQMNFPGLGSVEVDTDKEDEELPFAKQIAGMFRPMVGVECTNTMSTVGKISDVNIPEEGTKGFRSSPGGAMIEPMIKESIEKGSPVFPVKAIANGESWSQTSSTKTPVGVLESNNKYTYRGSVNIEGRNLHQFETATKVAFAGENKFGAKISIPSQAIRGRLLFDNDRGYLVQSDLLQDMTMVVEIPDQKPSNERTIQKIITKYRPSEPKK